MTTGRQPAGTDRIVLTGMEFHGRHGVWPQENREGQRFLVDVEMALDLSAAAAADSLGHTVDYAVLYAEVRSIVEGPPRRLIETLAEAIAGRILHVWPVDWVRVRVHKPQAPLPGTFAGIRVEVTRHRADAVPVAGRPGRWTPAERVVYLSLGSNEGDRLDHLVRGLRGLLAPGDIRMTGVSSGYETAPWGHVQQGPFLNLAARIVTALSPHEVLARGLSVEAACGRERRQRWGPRTLDIDLILVGDLTVNEPQLVIPHPHLAERAFVLVPLLEIEPRLHLPDGTAVADLLRALPDQEVQPVHPAVAIAERVGRQHPGVAGGSPQGRGVS